MIRVFSYLAWRSIYNRVARQARQAIRRGTFTSVRALIAQIADYINSWNA